MTSKALFSSDDESTTKISTKKARKDKSKGASGSSLKLKKPPPKHIKPGNWKDGKGKKKVSESPSPSLSSSPGPVVNQLDDAARKSFPTRRPLEDYPDLTRCLICKKIILKSISGPHVAACNQIKKEKLQRRKEQKEARDREKREAEETREDDEDEDEGNGLKNSKKVAKKSSGKKLDIAEEKKLKKRKAEADVDAEKAPRTKKKKKEDLKPKLSKQRGPVDVERQCGVMKDGVPCARSLTCKSHSMGAKRAVAGRSLPYDFLLAAYQKKNQAKQQKAAIDASAPLEDEPGLGPVDSDEELTAVMHGLSNWNPQPVCPPIIQIPIERKYMRERLREQLSQATNGFTVNIFQVKAAPEDTDADADADADAEGEWVIETVVPPKQSTVDDGSIAQRIQVIQR
ncbi:hypothetical protein K3495_g8974 [Podosphaera aphanis]|nr:hypothetical protein K3495_g8974 [Podosphaera aphanis]